MVHQGLWEKLLRVFAQKPRRRAQRLSLPHAEYSTAERAFALENEFDTPDYSNRHLLLDAAFLFLRAAIHSAVRVSTGEADEIAAQHLRLLR